MRDTAPALMVLSAALILALGAFQMQSLRAEKQAALRQLEGQLEDVQLATEEAQGSLLDPGTQAAREDPASLPQDAGQPSAEPEVIAPPQSAATSAWERKYRDLDAEALGRELERLRGLYGEEMARVSWPRYRTGDVQTYDPGAGQSSPASSDEALIALFPSRADGLVPYVRVTPEDAPELHDLMGELQYLEARLEQDP